MIAQKINVIARRRIPAGWWRLLGKARAKLFRRLRTLVLHGDYPMLVLEPGAHFDGFISENGAFTNKGFGHLQFWNLPVTVAPQSTGTVHDCTFILDMPEPAITIQGMTQSSGPLHPRTWFDI